MNIDNLQEEFIKHEYLDSGQIWLTITEEEVEGNSDESDKRM